MQTAGFREKKACKISLASLYILVYRMLTICIQIATHYRFRYVLIPLDKVLSAWIKVWSGSYRAKASIIIPERCDLDRC